jgi:hypothetical protein
VLQLALLKFYSSKLRGRLIDYCTPHFVNKICAVGPPCLDSYIISSVLHQSYPSQTARPILKASHFFALKMRSFILLTGFVAFTAFQIVDWPQVTAVPPVVVTESPITCIAQTVSAKPSPLTSSVGSAAIQSSPIPQRTRATRTLTGTTTTSTLTSTTSKTSASRVRRVQPLLRAPTQLLAPTSRIVPTLHLWPKPTVISQVSRSLLRLLPILGYNVMSLKL